MIRQYITIGPIIIMLVAAVLSWPVIVQAQPVRDRLMGDVEIRTGTDYSVIEVAFTFPVRYVRHFPLGVSKETRIQLEPIAINPQDLDALSNRESMSPRADNPAHATEVLYEGDVAGGPYLTVLFDQPVRYEVKQGDDYRSILVLVHREEVAVMPMPAVEDERSRQLQLEARDAMAAGTFSRAIQIYTKLADHSDPVVAQFAQELLGLARERNGQLAHAKAEYQRYLERYPDGDGAERVAQRLTELRTGRVRADGTPAADSATWQSDFYGGISQFYDREVSTKDEADSVVDRSSLDTNLDLTWRLQNDAFDIRTVVIGGHERDFLEDGDDETRINSLYLDLNAKHAKIYSRFGRQSKSNGGVLGRFDGGLLGFHLTPQFAINLIGGFPVISSSQGLETDKYFYGVNFDLGTFADHWDLNTYFIQQEADGLTDRQAVGGELRFTHRRGSFFTLIDYDIHHSELNTALFSGNLILENRTIINLSANYRKSPVLTTSNALIGQTVSSLDDLLTVYSETEIEQMAKDRCADSKTATLSITHPLTDKVQIAADVTWSKLESTEASAGVEAFEGTDDEFYYALQLIGSSLIKEGDLASLGVRYADTTRYDTYSGYLNTRFPLSDQWRINPKLSVDYREHKYEDEEQWGLRPSLRIEYRLKRNLRFEIEGGYEWKNETISNLDEETRGYFLIVGYRWDF